MTAHIARAPTLDDVAAAAARLKGTPRQLGERLRALLDDGPPKPPKGGTARFDLAVADHRAAVGRHEAEVDALRHRLAADFAASRGWIATTAPMAVKELARRSAGGNWHRPPREWLEALASPTFYRDAARRASGAVGHPPIELVESGRGQIEAWAAERHLSASFPEWPSWTDPGRTVLVLFESAEPAEVSASIQPAPAPAQRTDAGSPPSAPVEPQLDTPPPSPVLDIATMRPIAPIELEGAEPADLAGQAAPDWDLVPPAELMVDEGYQRGLSPKSLALIRRIVRTWSWAKFKPPVCARVDGRLHVIDGQHTATAAASHGEIPFIPVVVVAAPEAVDRARAFVSHATDRLQATITQVHHAAVLAGDEDAVTIDRVCRAAGVDLVPFPPPHSDYRPGQTIALNAIRRIVDRRGAMRARQILEALARADLAPITADHIRVGDALLCDPDYARDFDAERLTAGLRTLGARGYAEARSLALTKHIPMWKALVAVIYRAKKARSKPPSPAQQREEADEVAGDEPRRASA